MIKIKSYMNDFFLFKSDMILFIQKGNETLNADKYCFVISKCQNRQIYTTVLFLPDAYVSCSYTLPYIWIDPHGGHSPYKFRSHKRKIGLKPTTQHTPIYI